MKDKQFSKKVGKIIRNGTIFDGDYSSGICLKEYFISVEGKETEDWIRLRVRRRNSEAEILSESEMEINPWILDIIIPEMDDNFLDILELMDKFVYCINYLEEKQYLLENKDNYSWTSSLENDPEDSEGEERDISLLLYGNETVLTLSYKKKFLRGKQWKIKVGDRVIWGPKNWWWKDYKKINSALDSNFWCRNMEPQDFIDNVLSGIPSYISDWRGEIGRIEWKITGHETDLISRLWVEFKGGYNRGYEINETGIILEKWGLGDIAHDLTGTLVKVAIFDWLCGVIPKTEGPEVGYRFYPETRQMNSNYRDLIIRNDSPEKTGWLAILVSEDPKGSGKERKVYVARENLIPFGNPEGFNYVDSVQIDLNEDIKVTKEKIIKELGI